MKSRTMPKRGQVITVWGGKGGPPEIKNRDIHEEEKKAAQKFSPFRKGEEEGPPVVCRGRKNIFPLASGGGNPGALAPRKGGKKPPGEREGFGRGKSLK